MRSLFFLLLVIFFQWPQVGHSQQNNSVETAVVLETPTGKIFGTLSLPSQYKKGKVVLIIAGSGPTDRNGNNPVMKNNSLQQLAHALADSGFASLRFDKRGVAESTEAGPAEKDLRFENYVSDVRLWIAFLKKDKRFTGISIAGHSEGSLIGMIASDTMIKSFISIAGTGRPAHTILKEQLIAQPPMVKDPAYAIIDSLRLGLTVNEVPAFLQSIFRKSVQPYMISWFRYDPSIEIAKLNIPVLILQGTKDLQVPTEDADLLGNAKPDAKKIIIVGMNHVLKIIRTDKQENMKSYSDPSLPLSEELVKGIVAFLR